MPKALRKKLQARTARLVFTFIFVIVLATWAFTTAYSVEYTTTAFGPGPRGDISRVSGFSIGSGVFSFGWGLATDWEEFDKLAFVKARIFDLGLKLPYLAFLDPCVVLRIPFWLFSLAAAIPTFYCWRIRDPISADFRCKNCSYILTGNSSGICPECGTPVGQKPPRM